MHIIISHPTSNQNNRAVVKGLFDAGMLYEFHTAIAAFPGDFLDKLSGVGPFKEIQRRRFDLDLKNKTHMDPSIEINRLICSRLGIKSLIKHEAGLFSVDAVYRHIDKKVAHLIKRKCEEDFQAVYAYEDGAYNSFLMAKSKGINRFYDLPIGYWRAARELLNEEKNQWPDWASTLTGFSDSDVKLKRKDDELGLASRIFVASSFTAKSLEFYPGKLAPVEVIPYGFPTPVKDRDYVLRKNKLKLLFVGGLSQRKGIANMFAAVENLKDKVELTIVGRKSTNNCVALDKALSKHNWIPSLPHDKVLELMKSQDVLLFPSLFEGFGLVITEAMSQGTPVITTDRTAGPDLIQHNYNGWLVEAGSTDDLQRCIEELLSNPEKVVEAGKSARETARLRPWEAYGRELTKAILKTR